MSEADRANVQVRASCGIRTGQLIRVAPIAQISLCFSGPEPHHVRRYAWPGQVGSWGEFQVIAEEPRAESSTRF